MPWVLQWQEKCRVVARTSYYYGTSTQVTTFSGATESSAGVETATNNTWSYSRAPETLLSPAKIGDGAKLKKMF